jgi:hypothetical protein
MQKLMKALTAIMLTIAVVCTAGCTKDLENGVNNNENSTENDGGGGNSGNRGNAYGQDYVDLGLPSGTLWATCNVGAELPGESGYLFAWGETEQKETSYWSNYKYCDGTFNTLTKYTNKSGYGNNGYADNQSTLLPEDDAATVNWGGDWRMPTKEEWEELIYYTTCTYTARNGAYGYLFTATNGESIFLPIVGSSYGNNFNSGCFYWSSSLSTIFPYKAWEFAASRWNPAYLNPVYRYLGDPVRAVRSTPQN